MILGSALYRIPPLDASQRAMWAIERATEAAANVLTTPAFQNTQQLPFFVHSVGLVLTAGAAQYPTNYCVALIDPEGNQFFPVKGGELQNTTAALALNFGELVDVLVPTRWWIGCRVRYNAGANTNTSQLNAHGYYVPRGTLGMP